MNYEAGACFALGTVQVDARDARAFAEQHDRNPVHVTGVGNGLLPDGTVSGIFTTALLVNALMRSTLADGVLCAVEMRVRWRRPVREGDRLLVTAEIVRAYRRKRTVRVLGALSVADGSAVVVELDQVIQPGGPHGADG